VVGFFLTPLSLERRLEIERIQQSVLSTKKAAARKQFELTMNKQPLGTTESKPTHKRKPSSILDQYND